MSQDYPMTPEQEREMRAVARAMLDLRPDAPVDLVTARLGAFVFKDGRLSDTVSQKRRCQIAKEESLIRVLGVTEVEQMRVQEQAETLFAEWKRLQAEERTDADRERQIEIGNDLYDLGFLLKWEKPEWVLTSVKPDRCIICGGPRNLSVDMVLQDKCFDCYHRAGYEQLSKRVLAHQYRQQETYQIDGVRYVLEKGNAASTERWMLWMYPQDRFADFIAGDSIEEVFEQAAKQGVPVEKLTLDQWHD